MDDVARGKPTFIWDLATLRGLLEHPSHRAQEWAASHILELYPEAAGEVLQTVPLVSSSVAFHLLNSLRDLPLPEAGVVPLQQFLQGKGDPHHKVLAAALLLRHGESLSQEELGTLPMEMVVGNLVSTGPGFKFALDRYLNAGEAEKSLMHTLAQGCDAGDLFSMLKDYSGKERRRELESLAKLWQLEFPIIQAIHRVKDAGEARHLLQETLAATPSPNLLSQSRFVSLMAELDQTRQRITALLKATEEHQTSSRAAPEEEASLLLAGVLALHRDAACLKRLAALTDVEGLWQCLVLRPWQCQEVDAALAALLRGQSPEKVLSSLHRALHLNWSYFTYPFYVLESTRIPGRHQILLEALDGFFGEGVDEEAAQAQRFMLQDPEAMEALLEEWRQRPPEPVRLYLLADYPTEEVVQFLLDHFDDYMSRPFSRYLAETMGEVASPRFLEPLTQEWREAELLIGNIIWFLRELHGREDEDKVQHVPREIGEGERLLKTLGDPDKLAEELQHKPLPLPLRCTICQRTYHYQLERVYLGKRLGDVIIGQIIQCKGCGSLESYEITKESQSYLSLEMIRLSLAASLHEGGERPDTSLMRGPTKIMAGGRTFKSAPEAYHFLVKAIEREPEKAELHRRLGNMLRNGLRPDLSLSCYQEAVRLNPRDMEAVYGLAAALVDQERYPEAVPYVEELAVLCRDPSLKDDQGRDPFASLLRLAVVTEQETGHRIDLFPRPEESPNKKGSPEEPVVVDLFSLDLDDPEDFEQVYQLFRYGTPPKRRSGPEPDLDFWIPPPAEPFRGSKVGRNEPCPCGSGKKYKRCCGR